MTHHLFTTPSRVPFLHRVSPIYPLLPPPPSPSWESPPCLCLSCFRFFFARSPHLFPPGLPPALPSGSRQPVLCICELVPILVVCLVHWGPMWTGWRLSYFFTTAHPRTTCVVSEGKIPPCFRARCCSVVYTDRNFSSTRLLSGTRAASTAWLLQTGFKNPLPGSARSQRA